MGVDFEYYIYLLKYYFCFICLDLPLSRDIDRAQFASGWVMGELWLFWLAPLVSAASGALIYNPCFIRWLSW